MSKINCPTCHREIEDSLTICNFCGCPVTPSQTSPLLQQQQYAPKKLDMSKLGKLIISAFGIVNGIISIIFGIIIGISSDGTSTISKSYGGDAYTGIQNAAADTANNVRILTNVIEKFGSYLLIVIGIFIIVTFAYKLINTLLMRSEAE